VKDREGSEGRRMESEERSPSPLLPGRGMGLPLPELRGMWKILMRSWNRVADGLRPAPSEAREALHNAIQYHCHCVSGGQTRCCSSV